MSAAGSAVSAQTAAAEAIAPDVGPAPTSESAASSMTQGVDPPFTREDRGLPADPGVVEPHPCRDADNGVVAPAPRHLVKGRPLARGARRHLDGGQEFIRLEHRQEGTEEEAGQIQLSRHPGAGLTIARPAGDVDPGPKR